MSETTTSQEMQMQEDRGYLKGQADAGNQHSPAKVLLIAAAIILGVLGIVLLGPAVVGSAGGGASLPSFWVGLPGVA
jgi:hypothetical protein